MFWLDGIYKEILALGLFLFGLSFSSPFIFSGLLGSKHDYTTQIYPLPVLQHTLLSITMRSEMPMRLYYYSLVRYLWVGPGGFNSSSIPGGSS